MLLWPWIHVSTLNCHWMLYGASMIQKDIWILYAPCIYYCVLFLCNIKFCTHCAFMTLNSLLDYDLPLCYMDCLNTSLFSFSKTKYTLFGPFIFFRKRNIKNLQFHLQRWYFYTLSCFSGFNSWIFLTMELVVLEWFSKLCFSMENLLAPGAIYSIAKVMGWNIGWKNLKDS